MVPVKLALKNFLSYGQTTHVVDFEPYHLICLSGKNGHGKSALLDALTWVIWGCARKTQSGARADEHLVRLGQTQMMVSLEFICNGTRYRVRRELNISSSKTQTALDFGIIDPDTQTLRGLTDKTIRATQEKIISTIGLDYESFINSVFLRQGSSNEFSKKSPKDRKEILCSMLGITQFELIKKRAVEKSRLLMTQRDTLLPIEQRLVHELTQKERITTELSLAHNNDALMQERHQELQAALHQAETAVQNRMLDTRALQETQESLQRLDKRIQQSVEELRTARTEFKKIISRKIQYQAHGREHNPEREDELEERIKEMNKQEQDRLQLQQRSLTLSHALHERTTMLTTTDMHKQHERDLQIQQMSLRITLNDTRVTQLDEKISCLQRTQEPLKGSGKELPATTARYEKYREQYQAFVTHKKHLLSMLDEYAYSLKKLGTQHIAHCPTCTEQLSQDKKALVCRNLSRDRSRAEHQLARFSELLPPLKQTIILMHARIEQANQYALLEQQMTELSRERSTIMKENHDHQSVLKELLEEKKQHDSQKLLVQQDSLYQKLVAESQEIAAQLRMIPELSPEYKQELVDRLKGLKHDSQFSPEHSGQLIQQIKKVVRLTVAHLKTMKNERKDLTEKITAIGEKIKGAATADAQLMALRATLHEHTQAHNALLSAIGSYRQQLTRLAAQEDELKRIAESVNELRTQQELYSTIAQVLGKDGIPALLIEQALPEIEYEANALLEKLTDGQAHLFIESLRDLKSGKSKETLDIHISDATGIRSYELFSGGEAFRIDFALRIALSKLLARRAGTTLQTLIIDEGFGSQDEEGLAHIMEALYKIQDDFAKIIIVSHLPYMKEHFPVHFMVHKTAQGSRVQVMQQG